MKPEPSPKLDKRQPNAELVEVHCPLCRVATPPRNALLGRILRHRRDLLIKQAVTSGEAEVMLDVIYFCRHCNTNFVYGVIAA